MCIGLTFLIFVLTFFVVVIVNDRKVRENVHEERRVVGERWSRMDRLYSLSKQTGFFETLFL